jgi:hypothetical protein
VQDYHVDVVVDMREDDAWCNAVGAFVHQYPQMRTRNPRVASITSEITTLAAGDLALYVTPADAPDDPPALLALYERKNLATDDYRQSVFDGRIFDELERVAASGAPYRGLLKVRAAEPIDTLELGTDASLCRDHDIQVVDVPGLRGALQFLKVLLVKVGHAPANKRARLVKKSKVTSEEWTRGVLGAFLGDKQVAALLDAFPGLSLRAFVDLLDRTDLTFTHVDADDAPVSLADLGGTPRLKGCVGPLAEIPGIGVKTVARALAWLHDDPDYASVDAWLGRVNARHVALQGGEADE